MGRRPVYSDAGWHAGNVKLPAELRAAAVAVAREERLSLDAVCRMALLRYSRRRGGTLTPWIRLERVRYHAFKRGDTTRVWVRLHDGWRDELERLYYGEVTDPAALIREALRELVVVPSAERLPPPYNPALRQAVGQPRVPELEAM